MPYPDYLWFGKGRGRGVWIFYLFCPRWFIQNLCWDSEFHCLNSWRLCIYRTHSSVFMVFTTGTLPIKMIWYPLLAKDTGMTQTWSVESHCSAHFLSDPESANAESRPPNLRFLCPLEFDGNRFQWKPKGILASGNARLVPASSDFLKTGMVRIHTSPPSFSYSKSAVHLISHLDKCLTPPPHVSGYFWKRRFFLSFRKNCVYTWRIRIVFGCPHENGKTIEIRLPPFSCVHTNTISRHFQ